MKNIVLFENVRVDDLYPFSINHCSWEVRCGCLRLFEKIQQRTPNTNLFFLGRKLWINSFLKRHSIESNNFVLDNTLFLDGSIITSNKFWESLEEIIKIKDKFLISNKGNLIGVYFSKPDENILQYIKSTDLLNLNDNIFNEIEKFEINDVEQINYLWDAIFLNGSQINTDANLVHQYHSIFSSDHHGIFAINSNNIRLGKDVKISPAVVLDASKGMIIIGDNVTIMPQTTIMGPCFIGNNTVLKIGSKIYPDNSIGDWCKVGGELENTIIHSFSNKQHEGFLGHSYIGEWVNFGADTNNSDLKNTYSNITMSLPHKDVDTGKMFLGLLCGDHTKTGINSMFTTGTIAGVCGILVKEWFLPNTINSFTWGGKINSPIYKFNKAIETAKIVMNRRNKILLDEEIELLKIEFDRISKI